MRWEDQLVVDADRSSVLDMTREEVDKRESERVEKRLQKPSKSLFMLGSPKKWARSLSGKWRTPSNPLYNPMYSSSSDHEAKKVDESIQHSDATRASRRCSSSSLGVTEKSSDNGYEPDSDSSRDNFDSSSDRSSASQTSDAHSLAQNASDLDDRASTEQPQTVSLLVPDDIVSEDKGYEPDSDSSHEVKVTAPETSSPRSSKKSRRHSVRWHWHWSGGKYTRVALTNVARRMSRTARHFHSSSSASGRTA